MSLLARLRQQHNESEHNEPERRYLDGGPGSGGAFIPPAQDGYAGDMVSDYRAMSHTAVFACVRLLADTVATMPWAVYRRDKNNLPQRIFPTPKLIQSPCPGMDLFQWKWMVMATLLLRGNSYHLIVARDKLGYPSVLMPIHPDMVHVERRTNILEWYDPIYRVMGERVPSEDIVHIRRFTMPGEPIGLTPIQQAARTIGVGLSAEDYGYRYFRDSANPSSILHTDQSLTPDEVERNQKEWIASNGGRRLPAVLSGGFDWKAISISPEESQFLETRRFSVSDIARFYGVPSFMINDQEKATAWGTGIEQMGLGYNTYTVMGWTTCIESTFSDKLPAGQFVRFDPSVFLRGDIKTRYEAHQMARLGGWNNINEIRASEELPPIPNGDGYIQPVNYAPLGFDPALTPMAKPVQGGTDPNPGGGTPTQGHEAAPPGLGSARANFTAMDCRLNSEGRVEWTDADGNVFYRPQGQEVTDDQEG